MTVTAKEALGLSSRGCPDCYDEPFADSSQIPTYLVSAMTRRNTSPSRYRATAATNCSAATIATSWRARLWRALSLLPRPIRRGIVAALAAVPPDRWSKLFAAAARKRAARPVRRQTAQTRLGLAADDADAVYRRLVTHWEPATDAVTEEPHGILGDRSVAREFPDLIERMQFLDLVTYLPDDILTKVDRASMAVGLEARVPLLDHRVVEFAWRLPRQR